MLRTISRAARSELRDGDAFYRYGGDEFLAILPEQSLADGVAVMDRVRRKVEQLHIAHAPTADQALVTLSIGVAELHPSSLEGTEGWLARIDAALYLAKGRGRNRVERDESAPSSTSANPAPTG